MARPSTGAGQSDRKGIDNKQAKKLTLKNPAE